MPSSTQTVRVHRRVGHVGAGAVAPAVETSVDDTLGQQEVDDGPQPFLGGAEPARVAQRHPVDAGVARRRRGGRADPAVATLLGREDQLHRRAGRRVGRGEADLLEVQQRVVARRPLRLVEAAPPVPVRCRGRQERPADSLGGDPTLEVRVLVAQQVAGRQVGHGHVTGEQPVEHLGSGHGLIVAGRARSRAVLGWFGARRDAQPVRPAPAAVRAHRPARRERGRRAGPGGGHPAALPRGAAPADPRGCGRVAGARRAGQCRPRRAPTCPSSSSAS